MYLFEDTTAPTVLQTARVFVRAYVRGSWTANLLVVLYAWKYSVCVVYVCIRSPLGFFEFHVLPFCCEYRSDDAGHYCVVHI